MKIAVEGCCHGELDKIYETIAYIEEKENIKVDLLICCGDFQTVRNKSDLQCMAVPTKFQKMNTFYKYYSGEKKAPILTIFIGGNHEASNYLQELPYGGWVAPDIYYLGYAGVVNFRGVRIGGISGIFKAKDYNKGHFEKLPYSEDTKRSVYHIRNLEVFRLKQISTHLDIFVSHDWPRGIYQYGDSAALVRRKKHFKDEVETNTLGSMPNEGLLHKLQPSYWFSGHLHVKFAALVEHPSNKKTKFLALDKCLPRRDFLQIVDLPHDDDKPAALELDPEWLVILKNTNHLFSLSHTTQYMPGPGCDDRWDFTASVEEINEMRDEFGGNMTIPNNFEKTAPIHDVNMPKNSKVRAPTLTVNPQTTLICSMLDLIDPCAAALGRESSFVMSDSLNPDEISLDDINDDDDADDDVVEADEDNKNGSSDTDHIGDEDDDDEGDVNISFGNKMTSTPKHSSAVEGAGVNKVISSFSAPNMLRGKHSLSASLLKLPKPKEDLDDSLENNETDSQDSSISDIKLLSPTKSADESMASGSEEPSDIKSSSQPSEDEVQPVVKKFKRRNQSMYVSTDGDDKVG